MRALLKDVVPPVLYRAAGGMLRRFKGPEPDPYAASGSHLFDGEPDLFLQNARTSRLYGEYGMGASTVWMDRETEARILAVDTAERWVDATRAQMHRSGHDLRWVDVGPVGGWGMPESYAHRDAFRAYVDALWEGDETPDLVLVDGRFRIASFLTTLLRANPGTVVIFDDYIPRKPFHVVEDFLAPERWNTRQALFVVPEDLDRPAIEDARDAFLMVRE